MIDLISDKYQHNQHGVLYYFNQNKDVYFQYANKQDVKLFTNTIAHLHNAFTSYVSDKAITRFQVTTVALISHVKNNINNGYIWKSRQLGF